MSLRDFWALPNMPAPPEVFQISPEDQRIIGRLCDGFAAAGAGLTITRELFADAIQAQQDHPQAISREDAEVRLRQHFGDRYDAEIEGARVLVQRAAARCPEVIPFLEQTGLGNSPEFIRKLTAAASKRAGH